MHSDGTGVPPVANVQAVDAALLRTPRCIAEGQGKPPASGAPRLQSTVALTLRARAGDRDATEALCLRCLKSLTCYATGRLPGSLRGTADAQDLVLQAVEKGLSRVHEFDHRDQGALVAYMRKILRNLIVEHWRTSNTRPVPAPLNDQRPAATSALDRRQIESYEAALERVKSRDAELIYLRIDEQLGFSEIAAQLGLASENAARAAVKRAVLRLAHEMSASRRRDIHPSSGDQP
jgi:RNA polymerase sigma factor (sigma-70 family)